MFYPAIVINNNDFPKTGKIKVRIQREYLNPLKEIDWDLVNKPSFINEGTEQKDLSYDQDFYAYVFTPFGGKENAGFFALPRPNTKGLVTKMGDAGSTEYIWVGSYFESTNGVINCPNDEVFETSRSGAAYGNYTLEDENDIILRTKSLTLPEGWKNTDSTNSFNWKKQKTDNIISVGRKKIKIVRIDTTDAGLTPVKYEEIYMGEETTYKEDGSVDVVDHKFRVQCVGQNSSKKQLNSIYTQKFDGVTLKVYNDSTKQESSIFFDNATGEVTINANKGSNVTAEIKLTPTAITISEANATVSITKDTIDLKADKAVTIDAAGINIGGGEKKIVCTNSDVLSFKTVDGIELMTSSKVKIG
jgi:hypothetical protein